MYGNDYCDHVIDCSGSLAELKAERRAEELDDLPDRGIFAVDNLGESFLIKDGVVKWFNDIKGYGFIVCDDKEYFVHFSEIQTKNREFRTLIDGQKVTFEAGNGPKGLIAKNVVKV